VTIQLGTAAAAGEVAERFSISVDRARRLIESGGVLVYRDQLALVGFETSPLIGARTRDIFALTDSLLADQAAWRGFERDLFLADPAERLFLHGQYRPELTTALGFSHVLFYVEKEAEPQAPEPDDLEFRPVRSDLDIAFVRQCAALSVMQGMGAAFPGTAITADRLEEYLDAELRFASGGVEGIIAWRRGYPVAHATWSEKADPITGAPYVEMWDVDGLISLRRSGVLSRLARAAEGVIAIENGPNLIRGTVNIEPNWPGVWASLERQGWKRIGDLWAKYPWVPPDLVVDLSDRI
jgi:hypothetical protein